MVRPERPLICGLLTFGFSLCHLRIGLDYRPHVFDDSSSEH